MRRGLMMAHSGLLCPLTITPASAVHVVNYQTWQAMPPELRTGFVIGTYDNWAGLLQGDDFYLKANTIGLVECGRGLGLTPKMMIQMIDLHYENHVEARNIESAMMVLQTELLNVCRSCINLVRAQAGMDILP